MCIKFNIKSHKKSILTLAIYQPSSTFTLRSHKDQGPSGIGRWPPISIRSITLFMLLNMLFYMEKGSHNNFFMLLKNFFYMEKGSHKKLSFCSCDEMG